VSRLECFALFELWGSTLGNLDVGADPAATRRLFKPSLHCFVSTVRHVVDVCVSQCDQRLSRPSKRPDILLKTMGIDNFLACIQCHITLTSRDQARMLEAIFTCRGRTTIKQRFLGAASLAEAPDQADRRNAYC